MARRIAQGSPNLAVAYLRVSTDDQRLGPEAQRSQIQSWATREGISIVAWHSDLGVSGGADLEARPGLIAALGELRTVGAGVLVVAKRDRLARDVYVASAIERAVSASGASVACADGTANGDTAADAFMRRILDAAAEYERALIRARTKAALATKKARGELVGSAPYGYQVGPDGKALEPNEGEQAILATIREARANGLSFRTIVNELASRGFVCRSGKPFVLSQVANLAKVAA